MRHGKEYNLKFLTRSNVYIDTCGNDVNIWQCIILVKSKNIFQFWNNIISSVIQRGTSMSDVTSLSSAFRLHFHLLSWSACGLFMEKPLPKASI
jgi:hypothetical protein